MFLSTDSPGLSTWRSPDIAHGGHPTTGLGGRNENGKKRVFVLATIHDDAPGIAASLTELVLAHGLTEEGASGHRFGGAFLSYFFRQQLLLGTPRQMRALLRRIKTRRALLGQWATALPERGVWTISAVCPVRAPLFANERQFDTNVVADATQTMLTNIGANIVWDLTVLDRAPQHGGIYLHQHVVIVLGPESSLANLDKFCADFARSFGGAADCFPGACLSVQGLR